MKLLREAFPVIAMVVVVAAIFIVLALVSDKPCSWYCPCTCAAGR